MPSSASTPATAAQSPVGARATPRRHPEDVQRTTARSRTYVVQIRRARRCRGRAGLRFSKSWMTPPGASIKDPFGASVHVSPMKNLMVPSMTKKTSSSVWECAPGPLVFGSSHHSEIEYRSAVSEQSALNTAEIRPTGRCDLRQAQESVDFELMEGDQPSEIPPRIGSSGPVGRYYGQCC